MAQRLGETGLCVCPNYLSSQALMDLQNDFDFLQAAGEFRQAGIGQGITKKVNHKVRRDEIFWWDPDQPSSAQSQLWGQLDLLKTALNRTLFLGLQNLEGHYAKYSKDGFYSRHRDSLPLQNDRLVSLVLYLNSNWQSGDGGRLRIYDRESHSDIDPVGGTMVCFMSEVSEHEVCPSSTSRKSFVGWFRSSGAS